MTQGLYEAWERSVLASLQQPLPYLPHRLRLEVAKPFSKVETQDMVFLFRFPSPDPQLEP